MQRRHFLRGAMAGGVLVTMPAFLNGCSVRQPDLVAAPLPEDPFLDWFAVDRATLSRTVAELGGDGADAAELFLQHRRESRLRMRHGELGSARVDIDQGAGLRVIKHGSTGFAYTEDLSGPALLRAARSAAKRPGGAAQADSVDLVAEPRGTLYTTRLAWSDVGIDRKAPLLRKVDALARSADPSVTDVEISWSDTEERVLIATLDGRLVTDHRPMTRLGIQVTMTRNGVAHSGFANIAARDEWSWYDDERIAAMVGEAIDRTQILFDARRPPSGDMPVMLAAGTSGIVLHEAIGHAIEADFVRDGQSPYGGALNERVADRTVTVIDQATLENERGALNVDDEGSACRRNVLVEGGVLRTYLHDRLTALQFGTRSTGSGRRESYRHEPMPRMTCTFIEPGPHDREALVASMGRGLIAETYTGGNVLLGDGDFSFNVKNGWLVEKGKILMPVRDFRLVGNGPRLLENVTMVADDARLDSGGWTCGKNGQSVPVSQGMPSVLVSTLTVQALS